IAAVEAQAAGRPVIALAEGGVRETVVEGETGVFYEEPSSVALAEAVAHFDARSFDPAVCRANAERFDVGHFRHGVRAVVAEACAAERAPRERRRRPARGLALPS